PAPARRALRPQLANHPGKEPADLAELVDRDAEASGEHVEAAAHRRFQRVRALRRDPNRRMRLLQRLREERGLGNPVELAVVAEGLATEGLHDDVHRFVPALAPGIELRPEALEFVLLRAAPQPD